VRLATFHHFETAIALLQRGMHVSIVSHITHINPKVLRSLVREIHGKRSASGQMTSTSGILSTRAVQASASVFAALYRASGGSGIFGGIDLTDFLAAYDRYLALAGDITSPSPKKIPINITQAWIIARDIQTGAAYFQSCRRCHIHYLLADDSRTPPSCPICALKKQGPSQTAGE
jgi:hypothetical protein